MISAIVILVVLAVLGAAVAVISVNQQMGSANELAASKAYQAARAGQEWATFHVLMDSPAGCGALTDIALDGQLSGFTVSVQCTANAAVTDGSTTRIFYQLQSTACNQPTAGSCAIPPASPSGVYVERRLNWTVSR